MYYRIVKLHIVISMYKRVVYLLLFHFLVGALLKDFVRPQIVILVGPPGVVLAGVAATSEVVLTGAPEVVLAGASACVGWVGCGA